MNKVILPVFLIIYLAISISSSFASKKDLSIAEKTKNLQKYSGYFTFYWDEKEGKIWLEIDQWNTEFLYVSYLAHGIGSNDIGLDRGQIGNNLVVKFERHGPKVLLVQPNYTFRAMSDNPAEQHAVRESFAQSIIWGFLIAAVEGNKALVDATEFFLRDAHNVTTSLKTDQQGLYQQDMTRCAIYLDQTRNFPLNTEVEAILTFTGESPGNYVQQVVPSPKAITVNQHHSFVKLPDRQYQTRVFDPRAGYFPLTFYDYSSAIDQPLEQKYIFRHRLQKKDPRAPLSEAIKPIVYYVDGGTPEPVRSALMEGASWWNEAFEAIGYKNAFEVKILPENVDPLDIRYNVIQWIHRATRGWSYGSIVSDPRTGEILKGHVSLGSLRVRQDFLIAQGLLAAYSGDSSLVNSAKEMALARIRQLSAHEVGHTLGLAHNFAASAFNRASVMDYPHPLVKLTSAGKIDLSDAYGMGIGSWDKVAIAYGYQDFPDDGDEQELLDRIIKNYIEDGLIFISDDDARPAGGVHPLAHLWDNGTDPVNELIRVMKIRKQVIDHFSYNQISEGMPLATLEEVLVPIYMFHRYQTEAVAKLIGGQYYTYALKGDRQKITEIIPPETQREALKELLQTLSPPALAFPEDLLQKIPPRPIGYPRTRELFPSQTGVTFDPLSAAESAADLTISLLLNSERAARLVEYHSRDERYPGFTDIINRLIDIGWKTSDTSAYHSEIRRVVANLILDQLMALTLQEESSSQVKAIAYDQVINLRDWLRSVFEKEKATEQKAFYRWTLMKIEKFEKNPAQSEIPAAAKRPDGPPIGMQQDECGFGY